MADEEVFSQYPVGSWTVTGLPTIAFAALSVSEEGANRIVERERPYRPGAKLDDTSSKARRWTVKTLWNNSLTEPGLAQPIYPAVLNDLIRSFDVHETGNLVLPTVGKIRARAQRYVRSEDLNERNEATLELTFVEDNEDAVGARAFAPPSVKASFITFAQQAVFSAHADAVYSPSLGDLNQAASQLQAIANYPASTVQDIDSQIGIVVSAAERVIRSFTTVGVDSRKQLSDPDSSMTQRKLLLMKDTAHKAKRELSPVRIVTHITETTITIFDLAMRLGQDVEELIRLNPALDPLYILPRTPVRVRDRNGEAA